MPSYTYRNVPESTIADDNGIKDIIRVVNNAMQGKLNCTGEVELATGSMTTVLDPRAAGESWIVPMPRSSAAALALDGYWIDNQSKGSFRINHLTGGAGRMVRYAILA